MERFQSVEIRPSTVLIGAILELDLLIILAMAKTLLKSLVIMGLENVFRAGWLRASTVTASSWLKVDVDVDDRERES